MNSHMLTAAGAESGRQHVPCKEACSRGLLCGHQCTKACHAKDEPCSGCNKRCPVRCAHGHCSQACSTVRHFCCTQGHCITCRQAQCSRNDWPGQQIESSSQGMQKVCALPPQCCQLATEKQVCHCRHASPAWSPVQPRGASCHAAHPACTCPAQHAARSRCRVGTSAQAWLPSPAQASSSARRVPRRRSRSR